MISRFNHARERGSVLLLSLVITGMIAMLSLAFMSNMEGQLNVARDQAASLHADLAAQAGLEYAQRQLLLDSSWDGTEQQQLSFADGAAFRVDRHTVAENKLFESDVHLSVEGLQSAAIARFEAILRVSSGDPLLDKAYSVLGDSQSENLKIGGDYLIIDEADHLWQRSNDFGGHVYLDDDGKSFLDSGDEDDFEMFASNKRDDHRGNNKGNNRRNKDKRDSTKQEIHVLHGENGIKGIWTFKQSSVPIIDMQRIDCDGALYNYNPAQQSFANNQWQMEDDVHAPGWELDMFLEDNDDYLLIENTDLLSDFSSDQVVVMLLNAGETITLNNCILRKGLVVWTETDYDFQQVARNQLLLSGHNVIGGDANNIGLLAPGCEISTQGGLLQNTDGLSIVHSLSQVSRLLSHGVFIVLNNTQSLYDSDFNYDRQVSLAPPAGIQFFGELPSVEIEKLYESNDFASSN